jgi:hypothetical protein
VRKRFVIAINSNRYLESDDLIGYFKNKGYAWWSWIDGFWLVVDPFGSETPNSLRVALSDLRPNIRMFVMEVTGDEELWAGFGPTGSENDMFDWVRKNWK